MFSVALAAAAAAFKTATIRRRALQPVASQHTQQPALLVLVTAGLEDVAIDHLVQHRLAARDAVALLPQPTVALGEAAVGRGLVRLNGAQAAETTAAVLQQIQRAPVVQAVLALVAATSVTSCDGGWAERGDGSIEPTGALAEIASAVGESTHWEQAIALLDASGTRHVRRFRASCAASGRRLAAGFGSEDVMRAMGGGALSAQGRPAWSVSLYAYDVELFGVLLDGAFACGLLLGGEWRRPEQRAERRHFGVVPFCDGAGRAHLGPHRPWYLPQVC